MTSGDMAWFWSVASQMAVHNKKQVKGVNSAPEPAKKSMNLVTDAVN